MEDYLNYHGHEIYEDKRIFKVNEIQTNFGKNKFKSNSKHIT